MSALSPIGLGVLDAHRSHDPDWVDPPDDAPLSDSWEQDRWGNFTWRAVQVGDDRLLLVDHDNRLWRVLLHRGRTDWAILTRRGGRAHWEPQPSSGDPRAIESN